MPLKNIITSFNPWAESITGYSEDEALGRYCGDILQGGMCVEAHGGRVMVESKPGKGSTFSVFLPKIRGAGED